MSFQSLKLQLPNTVSKVLFLQTQQHICMLLSALFKFFQYYLYMMLIPGFQEANADKIKEKMNL